MKSIATFSIGPDVTTQVMLHTGYMTFHSCMGDNCLWSEKA